MTISPIRAVAMVWYRAEDYSAVLRVMSDSDKLPATFEKWLFKAQKNEKEMRRKGYTVIRICIDPETFPDWCRARGLDVNANARNLFAAESAKEQYGATH